jgi:hypothetical protein
MYKELIFQQKLQIQFNVENIEFSTWYYNNWIFTWKTKPILVFIFTVYKILIQNYSPKAYHKIISLPEGNIRGNLCHLS